MRSLSLAGSICLASAFDFPGPSPTFADWAKKHQRSYYTESERAKREAIFHSNAAFVESHNTEAAAGRQTYTVALHRFADHTHEEYVSKLLARPRAELMPAQAATNTFARSDAALPASVDWRKQGVVTNVRDQGDCGSCWAFSAVAAIEGAINLAYQNTSVPATCTATCHQESCCALSVQSVVDCTDGGVVENCDVGGDPQSAFTDIAVRHGGGLNLWSDYPYTSGKGKSPGVCHADPATALQLGVSGYVNVTLGDEAALQEAIATVPTISVCIDAGHAGFNYYFDGVYTEPFCYKTYGGLNHAISLVGYGSSGGQDYWLVKNSWGVDWGQSGYIQFARNNDNMCGIATDASFPTFGSLPPSPPSPPTPVPPTPPPAPLPEGQCTSKSTQVDCKGTAEQGKACSWCDYTTYGFCMSPDYVCSGKPGFITV